MHFHILIVVFGSSLHLCTGSRRLLIRVARQGAHSSWIWPSHAFPISYSVFTHPEIFFSHRISSPPPPGFVLVLKLFVHLDSVRCPTLVFVLTVGPSAKHAAWSFFLAVARRSELVISGRKPQCPRAIFLLLLSDLIWGSRSHSTVPTVTEDEATA
jgi:hypothetical protein